jgi:excisionase family DNA binding protein
MEHLKFEDLPAAMALVLKKLASLEAELKEIKENFQPKEPVELLTRREAAAYLKVDLSTLWNWSKKGILSSYGIGNRVYYKRSEIEGTLVKLTPRY